MSLELADDTSRLPTDHPHLDINLDIAGSITHNFAWHHFVLALQLHLGHSSEAPPRCARCILDRANAQGRFDLLSDAEWAQLRLCHAPNSARLYALGSYLFICRIIVVLSVFICIYEGVLGGLLEVLLYIK